MAALARAFLISTFRGGDPHSISNGVQWQHAKTGCYNVCIAAAKNCRFANPWHWDSSKRLVSEGCKHAFAWTFMSITGGGPHHELEGEHDRVVLVLHARVCIDAVEQHVDVVLVGLLAPAVRVEQLLRVATANQLEAHT